MGEISDDLIGLIQQGRFSLDQQEDWAASSQFISWVDCVSNFLRPRSSDLTLEWAALPTVPMKMMDLGTDAIWRPRLASAVEGRCQWLGRLPARMKTSGGNIRLSRLNFRVFRFSQLHPSWAGSGMNSTAKRLRITATR